MSLTTDNPESVDKKQNALTREALLALLQEKNQHIDQLQSDIDSHSTLITSQQGRITTQKQRIYFLEEALRLSQQKRFGSSSEKNLLQSLLFDEAELAACDQAGDIELPTGELDEDAEADPVPKKKRKPRQGLSADLPRVQHYAYLTEEEKAGATETFFTKVKEELDIEPARAQVIEYYQEKAVFVENGQRRLLSAEREPHPLGKSIASVALLSYIIISKYADGVPLYRLETILKRYGGCITRGAMAVWMIRLSIQLQPVVNLLEDALLEGQYVQGDETRMKVLKEPGMKANGHKWIWLMRGGPPDKPVVMFNYDKSRGKAVAKRLLEGFEGKYFQSDGYAGYDEVCREKNIVHLGCWDHARRGFTDAIKAAPTPKKGVPPSKAVIALSKIDALYRIERKIKKLSIDEKYTYRQEHSVPKLEELRQWLTKHAPKVEKDSLTRKAMNYTLNQWPKLIRYCDDGSLRINNILAENAIRPFAVGRKAWLFADTPAGAKASALYYTLIETAKANDIEPFEYIKHVVTHIATADTPEKIEQLLPWNMKNTAMSSHVDS